MDKTHVKILNSSVHIVLKITISKVAQIKIKPQHVAIALKTTEQLPTIVL